MRGSPGANEGEHAAAAWRPIESAPERQHILLAAWRSDPPDWLIASGWKRPGEPPETYTPWNYDGRHLREWDPQPIYWQPLPPPPEASPIPSLEGGKRGSANAISGPTPKSADTEAEPSGPVNCTHVLRRKGGAYPRTCERCGVGPCPFYNNDGTVKS